MCRQITATDIIRVRSRLKKISVADERLLLLLSKSETRDQAFWELDRLLLPKSLILSKAEDTPDDMQIVAEASVEGNETLEDWHSRVRALLDAMLGDRK
jgi:hypothetical protein